MGRPVSPPLPRKRSGIWYLIRRVPKELASVEPRHSVFLTTGIAVADDPKGVRARQVVTRLNDTLERRWRDLQAAPGLAQETAFAQAVERAREVGLAYMPAAEVAALPTDELVERIAVLANPAEQSDITLAAVLGGAPSPSLRVLDLPAEIEALDATTFAR